MLGWIHGKMATPESMQGFLPMVQALLEMVPQLAMTLALHAETTQPLLKTAPQLTMTLALHVGTIQPSLKTTPQLAMTLASM